MGARVGIIIITPEGMRVKHSYRLGFNTSNNEAKYEALLVELKATLDLGALKIEVYLNSRLVVNQVLGTFEARDVQMISCLQLVM